MVDLPYFGDEYIQRFGGKGGVLRRLLEKHPSLPVPPFIAVEQDESLDSILDKIVNFPLIIRPSSPAELFPRSRGLYPDSVVVDDMSRIVPVGEEIRSNAAINVNVRRFLELEGLPVLDRIPLMVQEYAPSEFHLTLMEHPTAPGFFLFYAESTGVRKQVKGLAFNGLYNREDGEYVFSTQEIEESAKRYMSDLKLVFELYETVKTPGWSFQIEGGLGPLRI